MIKKWKTIATKLLLDHPRISIFEDTVELPDGTHTDYIHFGDDHGAATIILIKDDKILLQKEYSYPPNEVLYQFPGGGIQKGETPLEAAKRELLEEERWEADMKEIGSYYTDNRRKSSKMYVFIGSNPSQSSEQIKADKEELFERFWFSEEEIDQLIKKGDLNIYSALSSWALYKQSK